MKLFQNLFIQNKRNNHNQHLLCFFIHIPLFHRMYLKHTNLVSHTTLTKGITLFEYLSDPLQHADVLFSPTCKKVLLVLFMHKHMETESYLAKIIQFISDRTPFQTQTGLTSTLDLFTCHLVHSPQAVLQSSETLYNRRQG